MIPVWTVDFETLPIGPRPDHYPPKPVGVAIRPPEGPSRYLAWGHPDGNNCGLEDAQQALHEVWNSGLPVVFHNAKFDLAICYDLLDLPRLPWDRVHDTMFLAFLLDPYAKSLGLKKLADIWLQMPPEERDMVDEWVLTHKADLPALPDGKRPSRSNAGAWIGYAPVEIVGPYAEGDTERTWKLFQIMMPAVLQAGMGTAYDVERQVLPIFMENERIGLRVDTGALRRDVALYQGWFDWIEDVLRTRLNSQGLNFDADQDVADALERTGVVTTFKTTKTGKRSVSKDNLHPDDFNDPQIAQALGWRNRIKTCLKMFMEPWLEQAEARDGVISCDWNQVAGEFGGARTGRPSTRNPNFLNISKNFEGRKDGYVHPAFIGGLPQLPLVRRYILPDEGHVILKRDFSGQELRVFGHFEHGDLFQQYQLDPHLDVHTYVGARISEMTGRELKRDDVKTLNFQAMYGGGIPAAQGALRCTYDEAKRFKAFHDSALPGRKILSDQLSAVARSGSSIRTWGGRLFPRPPFKVQKSSGKLGDADYVLINYLIQGSAADITKRAMIQLHEHPDFKSRFMLQVYDEIDISAPEEDKVLQMRVLREAMENTPLRVPLLSDGKWGHNWAEMQEFDDEP